MVHASGSSLIYYSGSDSVFMGLVYSFTSWRGAYFAGGSLSESFIGLDNYKKVFTNTKFLASLIYTVKFTVVAVLIINMAALALALLTNHILKGAGAFRTVFFFPIYWEDWHLDISGNLFLM